MGQPSVGNYLLLLFVIVVLALAINALLEAITRASTKVGKLSTQSDPLKETTRSLRMLPSLGRFAKIVFGVCILFAALHVFPNKKQTPTETDTPGAGDRDRVVVGQREFDMVLPAPANQQPELNPNYSMSESMEEWAKTILLTPSGYPYMQSAKDAPICSSPFSIKEAMDAWAADDRNWVQNIVGCTILPAGSSAEVINDSYGLGTNSMEIRLKMSDGSRATFYGPLPTFEPVGILDWYMYRRR